MAIWETLTVTETATWFNGTLNTSFGTNIVKIADGKDKETTFEIDEAVTITTTLGNEYSAIFRGTITVDGTKYPVVELVSSSSTTRHYAVGLPHGTSGTPSNLSSSLDTDTTTGKFTVCFFPGTLIATPSGERKIEELASGYPVLTGDSGTIPATWFGRRFARAVSVKWIGWQTVSTLFGPAERLMPVRFAAGSLGGGGGATPFAA